VRRLEAAAAFLQELETLQASLDAGSAGAVPPAEYVSRMVVQMRQLLTEARRVELRCHTILESANDAISVLTPDGILIEANRRWEEFLRLPRDRFVGRHIRMFAPEGEEDAFVARFHDVVATGAGRTEPILLSRADGTSVYVEFSTNVVTIDGETLIVAVGRDVTSRKRLEAQVIQSQKMEAIGRLTGGIAHDFNNLLAVILGNGELLRDALPEQDQSRSEAVEIVQAAHRAASLTRQLLAFSRRQVLEPTRLDLNSVVSGLERMLGRVIGEDVELSTALAPDLGAVRADAGQIEQVLMNLAVNARDAMPSGGRLVSRPRPRRRTSTSSGARRR
jgi:PAS domain S-box-containing protein